MDIMTLQGMTISELSTLAEKLSIGEFSGLKKQELIFKILQTQTEKNGLIFTEGVVEITAEGYGFRRER